MLTYLIIQCQNFAFVKYHHQSHQKKMHKNWEAVKFTVVQQVFQNSNFHLFAQMLSLAATTLIYLKVTVLLHSFSRKCLSNIVRKYMPSLNNHSLSLILSHKMDIPWKKWLVQLATQTTAQVLLLRTAVLGIPQKCCMCPSFIIKNIKKTCSQGVLLSKVNHFTASSKTFLSETRIFFFLQWLHGQWRIQYGLVLLPWFS